MYESIIQITEWQWPVMYINDNDRIQSKIL